MESQSVFGFVAVLLSRFWKLQQALRLNWLEYEEDETHRPTIQLQLHQFFIFFIIGIYRIKHCKNLTSIFQTDCRVTFFGKTEKAARLFRGFSLITGSKILH